MNTPRTVSELVALWPSYAAMAADIGPEIKDWVPRDWARRGSIPSEYIAPIVEAAKRRDFPVTYELVAKLLADGERKRPQAEVREAAVN